jgi:hypothetical protein
MLRVFFVKMKKIRAEDAMIMEMVLLSHIHTGQALFLTKYT